MFANVGAALLLVGALFSGTNAQEISPAAASNDVPKFTYGTPNPNAPGVVGKNPNGPTNPKSPSLNTKINQSEYSTSAFMLEVVLQAMGLFA